MKNVYIKTIILLAFVGFTSNKSNAQFVTIPDSIFSAWLSTNYPSCMTGNQMDTTCSAIENEDTVVVSGLGIHDLTGIQYFDNLITLKCYNDSLIGLPNLPSTLDYLDCSFNQIVSLPNLPIPLTYLNCSHNEITNLPALPANLLNLDCSLNILTSLPNLPNGLGYLICQNNQISSMPNLNPSLYLLWCGVNQLTSLPSLPNTLDYLSCDENQINSLPQLPSSLTNLQCNYNQITNLPTLPGSLISLGCGNNLISSLPSLPNLLKHLNCEYNQLANLPLLSDSLHTLVCGGNLLTGLPTLPNGLNFIECSNNQITNLPTLPNALNFLQCSENQLTSLPSLPNAINYLQCSNNQITSMPSLPNSLSILQCNVNQLTNLPTLPNSLQTLTCSYNQLTSLPSLPNTLLTLDCLTNNISCYSLFPYSITNLGILYNPVDCLPNYIPAMDSATLALPLCASGNTNGCPIVKGIVGKVYKDVNNNCAIDANESTVQNIAVKFYNPITNVFGTVYTTANGWYNYDCNPGTNFVLVDTLNKPYYANCTYPGIDTTVLTTAANPLAQNVNFDITCRNGLDLGVQSIIHSGIVFPGQTHTLQTIVGDASQWYGLNCSAGASGQVTITLNGPVTYAGVPSGALTPTINGNVYTYNIADFGAINSQTAFRLLLTTNISAQSGNSVCVNVNISTTSTDIDTLNNNSYLCYDVVNSYDPNYKEVNPSNVLPAYADWFTYTVHFQNLGTAAAININVLDTLDANLDEQTFEVINYSHYNETSMQNHIVNFRFPNILLPDSASNPSGSQGFVQYRIKPLANLPLGTQIENTAHIYFDYNPAVVTNTTVSNFVTVVGNKSIPQATRLWLYPNPSTGIFTISSSANIEVYNVVGELILSENNATSIDLTTAPKGMYFVKLNGGKIEKLIKN